MNAPASSGARVRVELLGPVQVRVGGEVVAPGGPKLRAVIALLALAGGRVVSVDELLDGVWGEALPATARNTLQYHAAVLRKILAAHGAADALVTRDPGYSLVADTDVASFSAARTVATRAAASGAYAEAAVHLADALSLWRGRALADLQQFPFADPRAVALESTRLATVEAWVDAELACGHAEELISRLQDLVAEHPTRERLWEQLMLALYRTGRQDAALSSYRRARQILDRELGVEPSARLTEMHQAVLRHDHALAPAARPSRSATLTKLAASVPADAPPTLVAHGGQRVALAGGPVVLGRHDDCDLVLRDEKASRRHAQVERGAEGFVLVDLGSTNGTYLNGDRVREPVLLHPGDRIEVGDSFVRFVGS